MTALDGTARSELIQPGQSFGKFYLVQTIGEGGTSRIFKALQQPINRLVALKIPSFAASDTILTPDEFLSEATLMARLEHPNVVRIYDFGVSEDRAFICMEYVEGWNLLELCQSRGPLPLPAALAAGLQTLDALLHSHSQGVLHLDLSPANVLVSKSGVVKLLDFGMAGKKPPTGQAKVIGTPAFLSPEHIHGQAGTAKSDLFSFGSLLYFAACGEPLFDPGEGNSRLKEMLAAIESARANPPESRIRRLPPPLARAVTAALTGDHPERIVRELKEAWEKLESGAAPAAVLRREMDLGNDFPDSEEGNLPTGEDLRARYFHLRENGRHREAVALLEKALRRQPDNPLLAELLAAPPAKAKTTPATMAVGEPNAASGDAAPSKAPAPGPGRSQTRSLRIMAAALGILAVTAGILAWGKGHASGAKAIAAAAPSLVTRRAPRQAIPAPSEAPPAEASPEAAFPGPLPVSLAGAPSVPRTPASRRPPSAGHRNAQATSRHPSLSISGPAGTHVSLNDSVEWVSPSPAGGWALQPGLINLTLTVPGHPRPINSSLFVSADSSYLIRLDGDGGFSVSRGHR